MVTSVIRFWLFWYFIYAVYTFLVTLPDYLHCFHHPSPLLLISVLSFPSHAGPPSLRSQDDEALGSAFGPANTYLAYSHNGNLDSLKNFKYIDESSDEMVSNRKEIIARSRSEIYKLRIETFIEVVLQFYQINLAKNPDRNL